MTGVFHGGEGWFSRGPRRSNVGRIFFVGWSEDGRDETIGKLERIV